MGREGPPDPLEGSRTSETKEGAVNKHVVICTHCRTFPCSKNSVRLKYHLNAKQALVGGVQVQVQRLDKCTRPPFVLSLHIPEGNCNLSAFVF